MFRFNLGQTVYYLMDNQLCSAPILARMIIENLHDDWDATKEQREAFNPFGHSVLCYATIHGVLDESDLFSTKEELAQDLMQNIEW